MYNTCSTSVYGGHDKYFNKSVKHKIAFILLILILFGFSKSYAQDSPLVDIDKILDALDFSQIDYLMSVQYDDFSTKDVISELINSGYDITAIFKIINIKTILAALLKTIVNTILLFTVFSFIAMLIKQISNSNNISKTTDAITVLILIGAIIPILTSSIKACSDCYGQIQKASSLIIPILAFLLAAAGGLGTSSLIEVFMVIVNDNLVNFMQYIIIPLITSGMVLYIISPLMADGWTQKAADLLCSAVKFLLGAVMTICAMLFSIRIMSLATVDGAMMRTAEYAIDDMIPIVGSAISDISSVLAGGFVLVKNAVGITAAVMIVAVSLGPILLLLTHVITFKLASFVCAVLGEKNISDVAQNLSKSIMLYLITCISILTCMFIIIMLCIAAGNKILMFR